MKKTIVKMLSVALSVIMVVSFAGCAGEQTAATQTVGSETSAASETKASEIKAATGSVNVSGLEPGALPIVKEGESVTLTIGIKQNANTEDYETNEFTKWLEETTGVNLDFVYFSNDATEAQQQLALMIAGGDKLPDILLRCAGKSDSIVNEYGEDGYYIDLQPYFVEGLAYYWTEAADFADSHNPGMKANILSCGVDPVDGARYAWAWSETSEGGDTVANHAWLNKVWLDKFGLKFPETIDELHDALVKFVNDDPNGNGKKDEMGIVTLIDEYRADIFEYLIGAYVFVNDTYLFNSTDGKIWLPYTTDEYREALKTLNKWYEEGLISPLSFTMQENGEMKPIFTPADNVAIAGLVGGHSTLIAESDNETIFEYQHMQPLKGETSLGGYANFMAHNQEFSTAISTDCENPEAAFRFLDYLSSEDAMIRCRYGTYERDWE